MNNVIEPSRVKRPLYRQPILSAEPRMMTTDKGKAPVMVPIVKLPLPDGQVAVIDLDLFNSAMRQGASDQCWQHSNGHGRAYVRTTLADTPGITVPLVRLALGVGPGKRVLFNNLNTLDMRRSNLKVTAAPWVDPKQG